MEIIIKNGTFYIVLALILMSFRKIKGNKNEPLSYDTTSQLKGIGILTVLIGHLSIMFELLKLPITSYVGAQGVEIFLFISAFGLVSSFSKSGLEKFMQKRLIVIFIPYLLFNIIRIPIAISSGYEMSLLAIIKSLLVLNVEFDPSMWYIQYILIWYIIFFLVFRNKNNNLNNKILNIVYIGIIACFLSILIGEKMMYMGPLGESMSHHFSFPMGALFFLIYDKIKVLSNKSYLIISGLSFIIYLFVGKAIPSLLPYYIANISFLIFVVFLFMFITRMGYKSNLLYKLGNLAYYIYLNELFIMFLVIINLQMFNYKAVPIVLLSSITLGIITKIPCELLINRLKNIK